MRHGLVILADEVYGDLAYDGPVPPMAALDNDAPIISYSSLSKAYLAPGWRAGWMAVGSSPRLDGALAAIKKLADGRLCSPGPMQYAVTAALTGDRSHQVSFRKELRARAELTTARLNAIDGLTCVAPKGRVLRDAAGGPAAGQDATSISCSGCCEPKASSASTARGSARHADGGFFRVVFLASLAELNGIYDDVAEFTKVFLRCRTSRRIVSTPWRPTRAVSFSSRSSRPRARSCCCGRCISFAISSPPLYQRSAGDRSRAPRAGDRAADDRADRAEGACLGRRPSWPSTRSLLAVVGGVLAAALPPLIQQAEQLWKDLPAHARHASTCSW